MKTQRALTAIQHLQQGGHRVTVARVAREARVSAWFVYNKEAVAAAVRRAIEDQEINGIPSPVNAKYRLTASSANTDLAIARDELRELKEERDRLKKRLQVTLGLELDATPQGEFLDRISSLEREGARLQESLASEMARAEEAILRVGELEAELAGARLSLRRMVRQASAAVAPRALSNTVNPDDTSA